MPNGNKLVSNIVIVGDNIAAAQTALAMRQSLDDSINITWISGQDCNNSDYLYGCLAPPESYSHHLSLNIIEPELLLSTNTNLSYGTEYKNWGMSKASWIQAFHLPFSSELGVEFHHLVVRHKMNLQDFIVNAQAAKLNRFAHPPQDRNPLSQAEYGYHFDCRQWQNFYTAKVGLIGVKQGRKKISDVEIKDNQIECLHLETGEKIYADLYIDCSGIDGALISNLESTRKSYRKLSFTIDSEPLQADRSCSQIQGEKSGWEHNYYARDKKISIRTTQLADTNTNSHSTRIARFENVDIGHYDEAFVGNCIAIGQAACTLEPISTAAMKMLHLDIERLLQLVPVNCDMEMERKEYNRRYIDDIEHSELFVMALYSNRMTLNFEHSQVERDVQADDFWACAQNTYLSKKLDRKLTQFLHRGILANFDLEPFNPQEWVIMHMGIGRLPHRYDRMLESIDFQMVQNGLEKQRSVLKQLASQIPPQGMYMEKLLSFLKQQSSM